MTDANAVTRRSSGRPVAGDGDARSALLRVAATRFSQDGYAGVSTRALLVDAGATAPALYHHFGSKTGLYVAVAATAQQHVLKAFTAAIEGHSGLLGRISAIFDAATALRREHPNAARFFHTVKHDVLRHPELRELRSYAELFDEFWKAAVGPSASVGLSIGLRAMVEGLLTVGDPRLGGADIDSAADALRKILQSGLR